MSAAGAPPPGTPAEGPGAAASLKDTDSTGPGGFSNQSKDLGKGTLTTQILGRHGEPAWEPSLQSSLGEEATWAPQENSRPTKPFCLMGKRDTQIKP